MKYDFTKIKEIIPNINLYDFTFNQKIQLMKAIKKGVEEELLELLANPYHSTNQMKAMNQVINSKISDDIKKEILNSDLEPEQILELKKCIKSKLPKGIIFSFIKNEIDESAMYSVRQSFEMRNKNDEPERKR